MELTRIINNPVIILAPTIVIRDQWVERFINNFTNFKNIPDWISTDIYNLKFFNVVTYQSLHYAYKKQVNKADTDNDTDDITEDEDNKVIDKDIIKIYDLINKIKEDTNLINAVASHKYIKSPKSYEEEILLNVSYYSSMLIFLNSANVRIPRDNVAILGHNKTIPRLTVEWLEILLKILYSMIQRINKKYYI